LGGRNHARKEGGDAGKGERRPQRNERDRERDRNVGKNSYERHRQAEHLRETSRILQRVHKGERSQTDRQERRAESRQPRLAESIHGRTQNESPREDGDGADVSEERPDRLLRHAKARREKESEDRIDSLKGSHRDGVDPDE